MSSKLLRRFQSGYTLIREVAWLHVLIVLAVGITVRWPLLALAPFFTTDSRCCYYHYAANQLLAGLPFNSDLHFAPGYSLFLATGLAVTDGNTFAVVLAQHLLGLTSGVLVYFVGRRLFGVFIGLCAAMATVLDVELALYEHAVMTETLFGFLLLCAVALLLLQLPGSTCVKAFGFGLLLGIATLVRPTGMVLPFLILLAPGGHSIKLRAQLLLIAVAGVALMVAPMMVLNKHSRGVFALTTSLQRNMLYPIYDAPERLLRGRPGGDRLLGQIKATITHHSRSPWTGPYGALLDRFQISNEVLDRLLMRVVTDFVLADPLAYLGGTMVRLSPLLIQSEPGATAVGLAEYGRDEYRIAGGPGKLGVRKYEYEADMIAARTFDQRTRFLHFGAYAWVVLAFASLGASRYYSRSALLLAGVLAITIVGVAVVNNDGIVVRYRYPVMWALYLLAASGANVLINTVCVVFSSSYPSAPGHRKHTSASGRPRILAKGRKIWKSIGKGELPLPGALLITVMLIIALAAASRAHAHRSVATSSPESQGIRGMVLSVALNRLDWHLPAPGLTPSFFRLTLPQNIPFDLIGADGLLPDGRADYPFLLNVGHEVQGQTVKFADLGLGDTPKWDTTGWYQPLLVIKVRDGEYISKHTDPRSQGLKLHPGDQLLVLAHVSEEPTAPDQFGDLRLHLGTGETRSYKLAPIPLVISTGGTEQTPDQWLTQYAAPDARVAMLLRKEITVVRAEDAFSDSSSPISISPDDLAAMRKWLHAETLQRHAVQYVWVDSYAVSGEAADAVLNSARLRPVLFQIRANECPTRWRGLFVAANSVAANSAPFTVLAIPHPLRDDEFQGKIGFSTRKLDSVVAGGESVAQLVVTNLSNFRWYGTCGTRHYPVGVVLEQRPVGNVVWSSIGETLLPSGLDPGMTMTVSMSFVAPKEAGLYDLRARLVQRPDRLSSTAPAVVTLTVKKLLNE